MVPSKTSDSFSFAISLDDSSIATWNDKCTEVLQYSSEEALRSNWGETLLPPEWRAQIMTWVAEKIKQSDDSPINLPFVAKDGERCIAKTLIHVWSPKYAYFFSVGHSPLGQCPINAGESLAALRYAFPIYEKEVEGAGIATFSSRDFEAGDVIFEEEPFVMRIKPADVQKRKDWNSSWVSAFEAIKAPMRFPGADNKNESMLYASMALVRDALTFVKASQRIKDAILSLSNPPLDLDNGLVNIAQQIAQLCHDRLTDCSEIAVDVLHRAILIFEVNTFPGGRMFWTMSRINHTCAPNALFIRSPGKCYLKALRRIKAGEEISISYFNEELLYPTFQRQWLLWRSKCFVCQCERCITSTDILRCRPCVSCTTRGLIHKRWKVVHSPGVFCRDSPSTTAPPAGSLRTGSVVDVTGEEIETEEGHWLKLEGETRWILTNGEKLGLGQLIAPDLSSPCVNREEPLTGFLCQTYSDFTKEAWDSAETWYDRQCVAPFKIPNALVLAQSVPTSEEQDVYMDFQDGCWKCSRCGRVEDSPALLEMERTLSQLAQRMFKIDMSGHQKMNVPDGSAALIADAFTAKALSLADDVLALCGPRHWAWNWGLVFVIDFDLGLLSYCNTGQIDARLIKNILDVWDWLRSLDITHDPSYYLHTRAVRALKFCARDSASYTELQRRVEQFTPFADCLGHRAFFPASRMQAA